MLFSRFLEQHAAEPSETNKERVSGYCRMPPCAETAQASHGDAIARE